MSRAATSTSGPVNALLTVRSVHGLASTRSVAISAVVEASSASSASSASREPARWPAATSPETGRVTSRPIVMLTRAPPASSVHG